MLYRHDTAALVPKWIPPNQMFWTILTTIAFALAAIAILINRQARLATRLMTLMLATLWCVGLGSAPDCSFKGASELVRIRADFSHYRSGLDGGWFCGLSDLGVFASRFIGQRQRYFQVTSAWSGLFPNSLSPPLTSICSLL